MKSQLTIGRLIKLSAIFFGLAILMGCVAVNPQLMATVIVIAVLATIITAITVKQIISLAKEFRRIINREKLERICSLSETFVNELEACGTDEERHQKLKVFREGFHKNKPLFY